MKKPDLKSTKIIEAKRLKIQQILYTGRVTVLEPERNWEKYSVLPKSIEDVFDPLK